MIIVDADAHTPSSSSPPPPPPILVIIIITTPLIQTTHAHAHTHIGGGGAPGKGACGGAVQQWDQVAKSADHDEGPQAETLHRQKVRWCPESSHTRLPPVGQWILK